MNMAMPTFWDFFGERGAVDFFVVRCAIVYYLTNKGTKPHFAEEKKGPGRDLGLQKVFLGWQDVMLWALGFVTKSVDNFR